MPSPLIEIPPDDIFKNDRLGLEPAIQGRTHALLARSPQAVAIDGRWGTGKSTFLALWDAYLRREGVKVVRFNAWKSFGADPFDTLTKEILRQVDIPDSQRGRSHKRLLGFLGRYAPKVAQGIRLVSILQPDLEGVPQAIALGLDSAASIARSESNETPDPKIESPDEFASILSSAAKTWSNRPVVVMVDELDRCSPEYSVEFLQLLEHVFHAEHVVFVVAINRSELFHSIKSFYGQGFNAEGYLERFFDDVLSLPASNRSRYIQSSLRPIEPGHRSSVLPFLKASELSLREIDKSIQVLNSVRESQGSLTYTLVNLWIARTLVPGDYKQFLSGGISDKGLADAMFKNGKCASLRYERESSDTYAAQTIEANLIICSGLIRGLPMWKFHEYAATLSQLFRHYQDIVKNGTFDTESVKYAERVLQLASTEAERLSTQDPREVEQIARRLERELPPQ